MMPQSFDKPKKQTQQENKTDMANWSILADSCKGCGLCVDACPKQILRIDPDTINQKGHSPVQMLDQSRCTGCGFCALMCPDCAIIIAK